MPKTVAKKRVSNVVYLDDADFKESSDELENSSESENEWTKFSVKKHVETSDDIERVIEDEILCISDSSHQTVIFV